MLDELARRGFSIVAEPGRRIVQEQLAKSGNALPWIDMSAFARRAIDMAARDLERVQGDAGWVFFDRGLIDAAAALCAADALPVETLLPPTSPYQKTVFIVPPWLEIFHSDPERRHGFDDAVREYERLTQVYTAYGHQLVELPKVSIGRRADIVLANLALS